LCLPYRERAVLRPVTNLEWEEECLPWRAARLSRNDAVAKVSPMVKSLGLNEKGSSQKTEKIVR